MTSKADSLVVNLIIFTHSKSFDFVFYLKYRYTFVFQFNIHKLWLKNGVWDQWDRGQSVGGSDSGLILRGDCSLHSYTHSYTHSLTHTLSPTSTRAKVGQLYHNTLFEFHLAHKPWRDTDTAAAESETRPLYHFSESFCTISHRAVGVSWQNTEEQSWGFFSSKRL